MKFDDILLKHSRKLGVEVREEECSVVEGDRGRGTGPRARLHRFHRRPAHRPRPSSTRPGTRAGSTARPAAIASAPLLPHRRLRLLRGRQAAARAEGRQHLRRRLRRRLVPAHPVERPDHQRGCGGEPRVRGLGAGRSRRCALAAHREVPPDRRHAGRRRAHHRGRVRTGARSQGLLVQQQPVLAPGNGLVFVDAARFVDPGLLRGAPRDLQRPARRAVHQHQTGGRPRRRRELRRVRSAVPPLEHAFDQFLVSSERHEQRPRIVLLAGEEGHRLRGVGARGVRRSAAPHALLHGSASARQSARARFKHTAGELERSVSEVDRTRGDDSTPMYQSDIMGSVMEQGTQIQVQAVLGGDLDPRPRSFRREPAPSPRRAAGAPAE